MKTSSIICTPSASIRVGQRFPATSSVLRRLQSSSFSRSPLGGSLIAIAVATAVLFSGCTTWQAVSIPDPPQSITLRADDLVRLHTKNGEQFAFKITAIEPDALVGAGVKIKYIDIIDLQVRRLDKGRTILLVAGVVLGIVVVAGIAHASYVRGFSSIKFQ